MIIDNVKVYTPDQKFVEGGLVLDQDRIEAVYTNETKPDFSGKEVLDGEGAYAIPGLIDLHFHGCKGDDFCDNSMEAIERIAEYEASVGVTAIAPATMTLPVGCSTIPRLLEIWLFSSSWMISVPDTSFPTALIAYPSAPIWVA